MVEKEQAKVPVGSRTVVAKRPDIVIPDKEQKGIMKDLLIMSDSNIKNKENEMLKKYQGLKQELAKMW